MFGGDAERNEIPQPPQSIFFLFYFYPSNGSITHNRTNIAYIILSIIYASMSLEEGTIQTIVHGFNFAWLIIDPRTDDRDDYFSICILLPNLWSSHFCCKLG